LGRPTSGTVESGGQDLAAIREGQLTRCARPRSASSPDFNLIPTLSAQENAETALVPLRVGMASGRREPRRSYPTSGSAIG